MSDESKAGPIDSGPKQDQNLEGKCILEWTEEQTHVWLQSNYLEVADALGRISGLDLASLSLAMMEFLELKKNRIFLFQRISVILEEQNGNGFIQDEMKFMAIMKTRGTPVQPAAAPANDGGSSAGNLSAKLDQLTESVEKLTVAMTKDETPTKTRAYTGQQEWENAQYKIEFGDILDGTSDEFLTEDIKFPSEEEVLMALFSKFAILVNKLELGLKVVDSETARWLPQASNHYQRYDLKPDGFVILEAFTESQVNDEGYLKGKPALKTELFDCIRSIIEGKAADAHGNEALGQAKLYAEKLQKSIPVLHVLLIDKAKFRACRFRNSNLVSAISGELNQKGSAVFLQKFLLGATESLNPEKYDEQHCALIPRVTELETATRESIRHWKEHYSLEFSSVLGKGMTGIVLQLRRNTSSDGTSLGRGVYAAKISHPNYSSLVQQEINNYELLKNVEDTKKCFATLVLSHSTETFTTILTQPVGQHWERTNKPSVDFALQALLNFHALGFVHGDARVANIRKKCSGNDYFLIDFASLKRTTDSASRRADLGVFLCSVLRKDPEGVQGWTLALKSVLVNAINATYPLNGNVNLGDEAIKQIASKFAKLI